MNQSPRLFGYPNHMGRPLLISDAKKFATLRSDNSNYSRTVPGFRYIGSGAAFSDNNIRDIWSGQVIALWVSNGRVFDQYLMDGIVTLNGHSPSNLSPLSVDSNGRVIQDLSSLLRQIPADARARGTRYVMGPDGVFGPAMSDILSEYARTGRIFGSSVPSQGRKVLDRLLSKYTTSQIESAKAAARAGRTAPSSDLPETPSNLLHGEAQVAAGFEQTRPSHGDALITIPGDAEPVVTVDMGEDPTLAGGGSKVGGGSKGGDTESGDTEATGGDGEEDNTLLYAGIASAVIVLGGIGYYYYKQNR